MHQVILILTESQTALIPDSLGRNVHVPAFRELGGQQYRREQSPQSFACFLLYLCIVCGTGHTESMFMQENGTMATA